MDLFSLEVTNLEKDAAEPPDVRGHHMTIDIVLL